ncbi:MAG TPA: hypothetical protein VFA18_23245, partial [Gemmataceae bacterium]|nr:hypothetical protein [Gemmataceae bacterium]
LAAQEQKTPVDIRRHYLAGVGKRAAGEAVRTNAGLRPVGLRANTRRIVCHNLKGHRVRASPDRVLDHHTIAEHIVQFDD